MKLSNLIPIQLTDNRNDKQNFLCKFITIWFHTVKEFLQQTYALNAEENLRSDAQGQLTAASDAVLLGTQVPSWTKLPSA